MAHFDSPIGSKSIKSPQLREFEISDETGYEPLPQVPQIPQNFSQISQVEQEIRDAREYRRTGKERLNEGAKKRIEMLLGMTRSVKDININNTNFSLRSLKSKEISEAYMTASKFDGTVQSPFEIRRQLLARSLTKIADVSFEQFIGSNDLNDKLLFMDEMDHELLNRLYDEYLQLVEEVKEKYAIKNEADAAEVVADLKK